MRHPYYPSSEEIDRWCLDLVHESEKTPFSAKVAADAAPWVFSPEPRHHEGNRFVHFTTGGGESFYGFWQPALSGGPAPLLLHLPGYGAEMSAHPELVVAGYNVLHVNPLGYNTPDGLDQSKCPQGFWPVLPASAETFGEHGYRDFLRHVLIAFRWATSLPCVQARRVGVFGSSQGGGTALLAASLLKDHGIKAVAADVTALTNFPLIHAKAEEKGYTHDPTIRTKIPPVYAKGNAQSYAHFALAKVQEECPKRLPDAWRALGFIDTLSHAHRLTMPTLLTGAELDGNTPIFSIISLFEKLPRTRSYTEIAGQAHGYTPLFLHLAKAWFTAHI